MSSEDRNQKPDTQDPVVPTKPNILMIMVDEYRYPRYAGQSEQYGMAEKIKNIVGFKDGPTDYYEQFFPGLMRLRENAVAFADHTIASSACIPSRAALFTGQYGTRTGVTQTDGVFKSGEDPRFAWLDGEGAPTMGDWMKAADYETYYFGKCHFADPPSHTLEDFGFDAWEHSYPEPHGTLKNNLGLYRDYGFADLVTTFLRRKALALDYDLQVAEGHENAEYKPWFAVASFTNPHDITTWPVLPGTVDPNGKLGDPLQIPPQGTRSERPERGTWQIPLNKDGFPGNDQGVAELPPSFYEDLENGNKPTCHYEYSLKLGLALACKTGKKTVAELAPVLTGMPFKLSPKGDEWAKDYLEYYTYLHYIVDQHIDTVMKTLDETGLNENTIVVFVPDHGEYGGAHGGMLQKWHTAYQETVQVPVVVSMPPSIPVAPDNGLRQVTKLTSHIDLLQTLLGLAGVAETQIPDMQQQLIDSGHTVDPFVGADLSGLIYGTASDISEPGQPDIRKGVLFATDDMITEYITDREHADPQYIKDDHHLAEYLHDYRLFKEVVEDYQGRFSAAEGLEDGPVAQPCHVVCYREDNWKLVRYAATQGHLASDGDTAGFQWELYDLSEDPNEMVNLVVARQTELSVIDAEALPSRYDRASLQGTVDLLYQEMLNQIEMKLAPAS